MSYNRIVKPRFYVDNVNWLSSRGWLKSDEIVITNADYTPANKYKFFDLNPQETETITESGDNEDICIDFDWPASYAPVTFVAILNHNMYEAGAKFSWRADSSLINDIGDGVQVNLTAILGGATASGVITPGSGAVDTLCTCTGGSVNHNAIVIEPVAAAYTADLTIGAIMVGTYFTMPVSGDMELNDITDQSGVSVTTGPGGKRHGYAGWVTGNDSTGDYMTFRSNDYYLRPAGREIYEIPFSYMGDTHLVPEDLSDMGVTDANYFFQVINKTAGQLHPMIVALDSTSTDDGDYLFARVMGKDTKRKQAGHRVFNSTLRIEQEF